MSAQFLKNVQVSLAETIGTAMFSLVVYMELSITASGEYGSHPGIILASGMVLMILYYGLRHISGAHLNPAVSFAFFLAETRKFGVVDLIVRVVSQIFGGITGAMLAAVISRNGTALQLFYMTTEEGKPFFTIAVGTMIITSIYLHLYKQSTPECSNDFGGIAIGFSHISLSILTPVFSPLFVFYPAIYNPATALGISFATIQSMFEPQNLWLYWVAPLAGALIGALLYRLLYNLFLSGWEPNSSAPLLAVLVVEALGTFALVFAAGAGASGLAPGFMLISVIFMGGYISGAEYNPA
ncbi:unnamed protein product, partial [Symbiodinium sp. KB8]